MADFPGLDVRVDMGEEYDTSDLVDLSGFLLAQLGLSADAELSVTLVDESAMAALHAEWMGEPGPTDVLSFPMDEIREPAPGAPAVGGTLGDVVLCPPVAERQAVVAGHSSEHEMRVLLTHGVLHLLGYDHADPDDERVMFARQTHLVDEYAAGADGT